MQAAAPDRVRSRPSPLAALDHRLWLALLGLWAAGRVLTAAQHIIAAPNPGLLTIGCGLILLAVAARSAWPRDGSPALALEGLAAAAVAIAVMAPLSYVATRSPFPPVDGVLAWSDRVVGFDAEGARDAVARDPLLCRVLGALYESFPIQYFLALVILPRTSDPRRGMELVAMSVVTLCLTCVVVFLLPTIGTVPRFEEWAPAWHSLHDSRRMFDSGGQIEPIVSLPSFHAAMAVMLSYCLRGFGFLSWIAIVLNVAMLLSTPVMGFHHIADIVAGIAVAATSILLLRRFRQRPRSCGARREHHHVDTGRAELAMVPDAVVSMHLR